MKRKRRKRSFTAKQAERLATISIVLYGIIVLINGIVTENADILYYIAAGCFGPILWCLLYALIFEIGHSIYK